jgi:hypothetical protein
VDLAELAVPPVLGAQLVTAAEVVVARLVVELLPFGQTP